MDNSIFGKMPKNLNPDALKAQLNPEQQILLNRLLSDKNAREKFLSSPEAAEVLKMLGKKR